VKTNLTGILELADKDYRALDAINKSGLDYINKSPAHFQHMKLHPEEPTDAMILGTATHYGVLEPELLYKNFFARPDGIDGRTKEGKSKLEELGKANVGKTMLKADEMAMIEGMMKAVRGHRVASQLISGGKAEMSAVCQDSEYGVLCKARPDYLTSGDAIIDLKTTDDAGFFAFQRKVKSFRYHVQAAWYLDVVNQSIGREQFKRFILLTVEKDAPHGVVIYEMDDKSIQLGRIEARSNLETYVKCVRENHWPGYPEAMQIMTVPVYV
jgi:PDDEXK-like domain of unknown function (DUF3799)